MTTSPLKHMVLSVSAIVALVVIASVFASVLGAASERVLTVFFISLIAVLGMGVYSGNSGILSFMAIGAYASSLLTLPAGLKGATLPKLPGWLAETEMGILPAILCTVLLTMAVAVVVGFALGKLEGSAATIATLGLLIIVHGIAIGWRDVTRGSQTFFGIPRETSLWVAAASCIVALIVARLYRDSVSGLRLRVGRENAIAASAVGVRIRRERLIAFAPL
jgi:branched-chain amino acid transport system permease protein